MYQRHSERQACVSCGVTDLLDDILPIGLLPFVCALKCCLNFGLDLLSQGRYKLYIDICFEKRRADFLE